VTWARARPLLSIAPAALPLAAALAVAFTWAGLALGFYSPYPISFLISALAFVAYLGVSAWQGLRSAPRSRQAA
jgi:hypothetical protein